MNTTVKLTPRIAAMLGALVADSAALGLHWLYDPERIAQIEKNKSIVFLPPDHDNYADVKGFFAHGGKAAGDVSGYGEICLLMLKHYAAHGEFNRIAYQTEFRNLFGPGGAYSGYVDSPTRQTLLKLIPLIPEDYPEISGADDDQFAALATVPIVTALHSGSEDSLLAKVEQIVRVTNHNDTAVAAAQYAAAVLAAVLAGTPIGQALTQALPHAKEELGALLEDALAMDVLDSVRAAQRFGPACHVLEGMPVIVHIVRHATSYQQAVEANIRAGGDSCGRAIMLGAIAAANAEQQAEVAATIPLSWLAKYRRFSDAANAIEQFREVTDSAIS
ncbi:MAG: ADP-ribosylglycohydrolase family protein [Nitrosomonas sp.]|nr:ADP-ribosylglycohydrolase family protein [Nitrosomonas sp.]